MQIRVYTNPEETEYAVACEGDQVMRATTARGINYPRLEGEYHLGYDAKIEVLPAAAVAALDLKIDIIEGSDTYTAVCGICGRETSSEWIEISLCAEEDEICQIGQMHYDCSEAV